jgi:hypothetical protein
VTKHKQDESGTIAMVAITMEGPRRDERYLSMGVRNSEAKRWGAEMLMRRSSKTDPCLASKCHRYPRMKKEEGSNRESIDEVPEAQTTKWRKQSLREK